LKEINSKDDLSGDEFLNLNSLDNELFSLINEVNTPKIAEEADSEESPGGEKSEVVDKIYTRPLKLPESMKTDADVIDRSAEDEIHAAEPDVGDISLTPSGEKPNTLEEQAPRAGEPEEDRISTEDAQAMAAALSQLEEQMGVVVGEDIPLIETPPAEVGSSPQGSGLDDTGVQAVDGIQELAEGQVSPDAVPTDEAPALAEEAPAEVVEPEAEALAAASSGGLESDTTIPPESPENEPVLEEVQVAPASLDEEEIPGAAISDTRPTIVENPAINAVDEQVVEAVPEMGKISPPSAPAPEDGIETVIEMKGHPFTGEQLYTVVFAPRRSGQFLTGEVVDYLGNMLKTSATGFPWRLTGMAIRPEYLRLTVEISHHLDPASIIDFIKEYTDHVIRQQHSQMGKENNDAPYWAKEYLSLPDYSIPEGDQLRAFLKSIKPEYENPVESV
jgi:REP element-mobilizing transposase RayT